MPGLMACRAEFGPAQPLKGVKITGSLHMTIQVRQNESPTSVRGRVGGPGDPREFTRPFLVPFRSSHVDYSISSTHIISPASYNLHELGLGEKGDIDVDPPPSPIPQPLPPSFRFGPSGCPSHARPFEISPTHFHIQTLLYST